MSETKLGIYDFGKQLLETNDLDPVYVLLWNAGLPLRLLKRWLLAYWAFYHVGTASWCADVIHPGSGDVAFWERMAAAADSKDYPRSSERRHFRGRMARASVAWLRNRGVDQLFEPFMHSVPLTVGDVMGHVKDWYGFGDWIAFKVADMLERLDICQVAFTNADAFLFGSPQAGAELMYQVHGPGLNGAKTIGEWAVSKLTVALFAHTAPPRHERPINGQEMETVLCKWKSYMGGHYEIGEDIAACRRGLLRFAKTNLAQTLYAAGSQGDNKLW